MAKSTTITMTDADIKQIAKDATRRRLTAMPLIAFIVVFVVAGVVLLVLGIQQGVGSSLFWAGLGLIALNVVLVIASFDQSRKSTTAVMPSGSSLSVAVEDEGLRLKSSEASETVPWKTFSKLEVVGKTAVFRQRGTAIFLALPGRAFTEDTVRQAQQNIAAAA